MKMEIYFVIFAAAMLARLTQGYTANDSYPTFAPCKQDIISAIKTHWIAEHSLGNNLKKLQATVEGYTPIFHSSYNSTSVGDKCVYIKITKDNIMDVKFVPRNGGPAANMYWKLEQSPDGIIKGSKADNDLPEYKWDLYVVFFPKGITANYVCSTHSGSTKKNPLGYIMASKKDNDVIPTTEIQSLYTTMTGWGINFQYKHASECDLNSP